MTGKKINFSITILIIIVGLTANSWAGMQLFNESKVDTLMKRLEEKGVLTKEEIAAIQEEDNKTKSETSLNISFYAQFRGEFKESDTGERTDDLNVRRLRLNFQGNAFPEISYLVSLAADQLSTVNLREALLTFSQLGPKARLSAGQFKTPFSRHYLTSSTRLQMIESATITNLVPGYDTGIILEGANIAGDFDYAIALESGVGLNRKYSNTENSEFNFSGRLAYHPLGTVPLAEGDIEYSDKAVFELGANGYYAPGQVSFGERSINDVFLASEAYPGQAAIIRNIGVSTTLSQIPTGMIGDTQILGPDVTFRFRGMSLTGEYYKATYTPTDIGTFRKIHSVGYFVQGGVFVIPHKLELAARFDRLDRNTEITNQNDTREYTFGVNYFPRENHNLKVQANYVWRVEDRNEIDNNSVIAQVQVRY